MSKKQLSNYKFYPGVIPPEYDQYPNTVALLTANKDYIVGEATEYLSWRFNTPENPPANVGSVQNEVSLLLANKNFIVEEANAWTLSQIENNISPFVGYDYDEVKQEKCKRDIGFLVDAFAFDLAGGGNTETIRISRMFYLDGIEQLLSPVQEAAVHEFVKVLIADFVLTRTLYPTDQDPIVAAQELLGDSAISDPSDLAISINKLNELNDIVINLITDGLSSLPELVYNYDETFANLVYEEGYTSYDEAKCIRDTTYVIDAYLYDLTYGGNSLTYYIASQYQVLGVYTVRKPEVELSVQTFVRNLIDEYILENIYHPSYQLEEQQTLLPNNGESSGKLQLLVLSDILLNVLSIGSSTLPAPVAPDSQSGGLLPNAVALFESNKRYIQEEAIAFIQNGVDNNLFPFVFFTYNATKCRRDISYVLEGYLKDLKNGGNLQTIFNASKYWENGVAQVDGDRLPEVFTQTFIRDLIENFIWTNVAFDSRQILASQVFDNANPVETFANTRIKELSNTILEVIEFGVEYIPVEISNRGYIKVPGYYKLKDFLLITNNSRNQIMFNFADETSGAQVTYSEDFDPDFAGALFGVDKITKLVFDVDTSRMMITDDIQIFVEGKEQAVRLNSIATDAMERVKVGIPQSMLDADFEYGLQPTKWQAIGLMRNYPSIYEIPGSDTGVVNVTTDASASTGGTGASLIEVTTVSSHGLILGDPITIKALSNNISGFSRAEGSFLVSSIPSATRFTYYAKSKVGTTPGQVLASSSTQLRKGGFYTGSSIGSPTISVFSSGLNGSVNTLLTTLSGSTSIGFSNTPPPIGAPLSGPGISSGTQVTSVVGSGGASTSSTLTVRANIGATSITVNDTSAVSTGLLFDRGDGVGVAVTNIVGNAITLSGALTAEILGTTANYTGLSGATSGSGTSAVFTVARSGGSYSATITTTGTGYVAGDTITIVGSNLDGLTPTNNATITVTAASLRNFVSALNNATLLGGTGYIDATGVTTFIRLAKTITVSGNATVSTAQSKFGVGSILFDGTGDFITAASSADFGYGTGDFTIETFVRINSLSATAVLIDQRTVSPEVAVSVSITTEGVIRLNIDGTNVISSNTTVSTDIWYHFALSRASGTTRMFIDGVAQTTTYSDSNNYPARPIRFGATFAGTAGLSGYLDEIRVTKGISRYSATFTPTTTQFVNDANTVLLIHANTTISDDVGGTGLTVNLTTSSGVVTAVAINASGSGYSVGNLVNITNPNPIGAVTAFSAILPTGTLYTTANGLATTGGTGTGLTVDIVASGGAITNITVNNKGSGYSVNDFITILGGSSRGAVVSTGSFTQGNEYTGTDGETLVTQGGAGTGLTVSVVYTPVGEAAEISLVAGGSGYTTATGVFVTSFGDFPGVDLTIDIVADEDPVSPTFGQVISVTINQRGSGYVESEINEFDIIQAGSDNIATIVINAVFDGRISSFSIVNAGTGYAIGNTITIGAAGTFDIASTFVVTDVTVHDGAFTVSQIAENASIEILTVSPGGAISSISTTGTPITAPTKDFISAFTISEPTTALIASENTDITYSAIATIQATFATAHGLVPGNTITVDISSTGTGAQLAAGPYFVERVPTPTTLIYTARAAGTIDNTLVGQVYGRPDSFFIHRPFDGGVQLGTAGPSHGAVAIRMSKKYIRYQSGKGVMYNTGALFAPSYDIRSMTASGTAVGSVITITTDDTDHGCQVGGGINIEGSLTPGYDGPYTVASVITERVLTVIANKVLGSTSADIGSPCEMSIRNWHGSTIRSGIFDDQNGMFWQYDGIRMAVVRRSATFQIAGSISIEANSNLVTGDNTRFYSQLSAGEKVVIRGMTHVVTSVLSNNSLTVAPDFRGVVDVVGTKMTKVIDLQVPQEDWNLDTLNGAGPSGYNLDVTKMQMIGIQHTWYGAGFIDYMLRGSDGNYVFANRIRNSNVNSEAYMRTGNQPVRYEVINEGARSKLSEAVNSTQTVLPLEDTYWFPDAGTVYVDNELINYTARTETALTGCTRAATLSQFTAGSQRSFTAGPAVNHVKFTGVILVSNTITPIISHWGSAFMIDGQFDDDRGYIFNYAATGVSATLNKTTAFLIRLAPSVSNALVGDLGEKELLNRAQLLLSGISVTSDDGQGAIVIEGVLNPINYPLDPTAITWQGLSTQAQGGQPSFAQVASGGSVTWGAAVATSSATVQGAFTTTLTATSFDPDTVEVTAKSVNTVTDTITVPTFNVSNFQGRDLRRAFISGRNDFIVFGDELDAFTTTLSLQSQVPVGDLLAAQGVNIGANRRISSVERNWASSGGREIVRVIMTQNSLNTSNSNTPIDVTITFQVSINYASALSASRSDFIITQTQFESVSLSNLDLLSATTFLTGGQSISTLTPNFALINGIEYARIQISSVANNTSNPGSGNDVTVTVSAAATILYGRAISASRQDFLVPQSQLATSGVLVGDRLNAATVLVDGQAIQQINNNFITINSISYGRIVMTANGSVNSSNGAGNNVTVTVTAAGSASTYNGNFVFFTGASFISSGATTGTRVSTDDTQFPAGTAIAGISTRTFNGTTVYRVTFSQSATTTIAAAGTIDFQFGAEYALPGETVFSFIANPGGTETLDLSDLKELTSSTLGGRGAFPNGPDVLAINVYKISGAAVPTSIILRWGEAQA